MNQYGHGARRGEGAVPQGPSQDGQAGFGAFEEQLDGLIKASFPCFLLPPPMPVLAEASVRGLEDQKLWQVGKEGATLKCLSEGHPPPSYNWTR